MWGGIVSTSDGHLRQAVVVCAWCADAKQRTEDAMVAGLNVTHGICAECRSQVDPETLSRSEVRAWGNRLLAQMSIRRQHLATSGLTSASNAVGMCIAQLDGALGGLLDGMGPRT